MFYFPISHQEIAQQIAGLLNSYNGLTAQRSSNDILHSKANYVVETHGRFVIGAAAIQKTSYQLSELKHMVVHPDWREKGVGHFVGKRALQICETPVVYATARTTNIASLRTLEKLGFNRVEEFPTGDHSLALLVRITPKWKNSTPKSNSLPEMNWAGLVPLSQDSLTGLISPMEEDI